MDHFRDVTLSQSLSMVLKKLNLTQQNQTCTSKPKNKKLNPRLVVLYDVQPENKSDHSYKHWPCNENFAQRRIQSCSGISPWHENRTTYASMCEPLNNTTTIDYSILPTVHRHNHGWKVRRGPHMEWMSIPLLFLLPSLFPLIICPTAAGLTFFLHPFPSLLNP